MNWLLNRLKERSTWFAIFTMAGLVGIKIEPELREVIINAILAVAAVIAFVFRENVRERSTDQDQSPRTPLPPIELQGQAESTNEFPNIPPLPFDDATPHRPRNTDISDETVSLRSSANFPQGDQHNTADTALRNRRHTGDWLRDPVPSVPRFKHPADAHKGSVGWNDDR